MKSLLFIFALMCGISCTNPTNSSSSVEQTDFSESTTIDSIYIEPIDSIVAIDTTVVDSL